MSGQSKYTKTEFINFVLTELESISSTPQDATEYLKSEGLDVEEILEEGRKRLSKIRLNIEAGRTRAEMLSMEAVKDEAMKWVDKLMSSHGFSFADFIKTENLALQNRNIEGFTKDDIKNTLVQYFTLKFFEEQGKNSDGSHQG